MLELKRISKAAVPSALAKAERYRLLNEPEQAESICRDVLAVEPDHQGALVTLLLAVTDQFRAQSVTCVRSAEEVLAAVSDGYQRLYYDGIIRERWALALLEAGDAGHQAFQWLDDAMKRYEAAAERAADGNDDAILRWNSCARIISRDQLHADDEESPPLDDGDGAPPR
jgi:hypothetical protein